ncbi:M48 family metalloprotease [Archangium sp.]|uniref:M48 family metalloprotease n=1 Tax=Archangium sp. TaxID=1872627 RepID=UPI003899CEF7
MKKQPNSQMAELGPFYQVCWLGLFACALNLLALFCYGLSLGFGLNRPVITGGAMVTFLVTWRVIHGRQKHRLEERAARGVTPVRPRLQHTLDALGDKLRAFSGDASARLVLLPESAVVLSTLRSKRGPVVEMTVGFLNTYASNPRLMEAALAHEAGHIAARDVERFLRMLSLMRTLAWFALLCLSFWCVTFVVEPNPSDLALVLFVTGPVLMALVMALAWSALLVAREVQADAFAVKVLGERHPMEALLERQLARRAAQAGRRNVLQRLRTWLIQPDLRWRSTLPFLRGRLGARVEAKLGLATAAFFSTLFLSMALLWLTVLSWSVTSLTDLEAVAAALEASSSDEAFATSVGIVCLGMALGASTWVVWIAYRFYWVRSRTSGRGDSGTRSSGLRSVLFFVLPGWAFLVVELLYLNFPEEGVKEGVIWDGLLILPTLAVLLWAVGKVSLVSTREQRRERPSLTRAFLSLLGILVLVAAALFVTGFVTMFVAATVALTRGAPVPSPSQLTGVAVELSQACIFTVSLGAGLLAHRLAAPARTSGPHAEAPPRGAPGTDAAGEAHDPHPDPRPKGEGEEVSPAAGSGR